MAHLPPVLTSPHSGAHQKFRPTLRLEHLGYALWLGGPLCVLLLAATMSVGPGRSVSLPGLGQIPETCTLHTRLGIDCPGCGLTRSFIHLAHGRVQAAWDLNSIALFLFAYVACQIPLAVVSFGAATALGKVAQSNATADISQPSQPPRALAGLSGWAQFNQWLLIGLMLALLLRWGVYLVTGGLLQ